MEQFLVINHQGDVIGFIAHMDTSPDASGKDIHPQIIKNYQGQKITLNEDKKLYLDPEQYPQLLHLMRKTMDKQTGRPDRATLMHCWIIGFVEEREYIGLDTFPKDIEKEFSIIVLQHQKC